MKLLVKDRDLSELVESITWGGDSGQISRKLEFTVAQNVLDKNFPAAAVNGGPAPGRAGISGCDF